MASLALERLVLGLDDDDHTAHAVGDGLRRQRGCSVGARLIGARDDQARKGKPGRPNCCEFMLDDVVMPL